MISWVTSAPMTVVPSRGSQMLGFQPFIRHRRLLVEDHPRHDHRADIGRDEIEISVVAQRQVAEAGGELPRIGMRPPRDPDEGQLEESQHDRHAFDRAIGARRHH
jgi:hypothetical protein